MATRATKAVLLKRIKQLEAEIDDIHSFHYLPIVQVTPNEAYDIIESDAQFIRIDQYAKRYCLHNGEIGQCRGRRYCIKRS